MTFQNQYTSAAPERPKWEQTPDGFLRCKARVLAERIMPYARHELSDIPDDVAADPIMMLVTRDTMAAAESLRSLEGAPLTIGDHQWLTPELVKEFGKGAVAGAPTLDGPYLVCDLMVTDPGAIQSIMDGACPEISAAYTAETVFEPGEWDGEAYDAKQTKLRYNHIAIIPEGHGRAGADVRILNKKGAEPMVRLKLANGKYVNVDEEAAKEIEGAQAESASSLEETMNQLEAKSGEMSGLQAEVDELKGELSVYKEKLDALLSTEAIEHAAAGMATEAAEGAEILENADFEKDEEKEQAFTNSKGLFGSRLHTVVLNAVGVDTEGMSPDELRGAFRAQNQMAKKTKPKAQDTKATVAGARIFNSGNPTVIPVERTAHQRLGFPAK